MYRRLFKWLASPPAGPQDFRRAARRAEPTVVVYYWNGSVPVGHKLRDISETGTYLYTTERWYIGTVVRLLLQQSDSGHNAMPSASMSVPARVVWHGSDGMALDFEFRTPADRLRLAQIIARAPNAALASLGSP